MQALLEFDRVSKVYSRKRSAKTGSGSGRVYAAHDVSFTVNVGDSLGIVGESGAGKTTIAELAAGLRQPSSGSVTLNGQNVSRDVHMDTLKTRARVVQLIWQDARGSMDPRLRVEKILAEPIKTHRLCGKKETKSRVWNALEEVGLSNKLADRYPHELSGGEAQRVVIARALVLNPILLICDEPASALDASIKSQLADLLEGLRRKRRLALLIIAHDLPLIRRLTETLMVMRGGEVIEQGRTEEILAHPRHPYTRLLIGSEPFLIGNISNKEDLITGRCN